MPTAISYAYGYGYQAHNNPNTNTTPLHEMNPTNWLAATITDHV